MPIGTSDGYQYENETQLALGNGVPITTSGMPPRAPAEATGALNSETGSGVPKGFDPKQFRRSENVEDERIPADIWGTAFGAKEGGPPAGVDVRSWIKFYYPEQVDPDLYENPEKISRMAPVRNRVRYGAAEELETNLKDNSVVMPDVRDKILQDITQFKESADKAYKEYVDALDAQIEKRWKEFKKKIEENKDNSQ